MFIDLKSTFLKILLFNMNTKRWKFNFNVVDSIHLLIKCCERYNDYQNNFKEIYL